MSDDYNNRKCLRLNTGQITRLRTVTEQGEAEFQKGQIGNLSKAGVFIETPAPYPLGTTVEFELRLPNWSSEIHVVGIVRRCQDQDRPFGIGIEFSKINMNAIRALDEYVDAYLKEMDANPGQG